MCIKSIIIDTDFLCTPSLMPNIHMLKVIPNLPFDTCSTECHIQMRYFFPWLKDDYITVRY